jgi:hypothetical protein
VDYSNDPTKGVVIFEYLGLISIEGALENDVSMIRGVIFLIGRILWERVRKWIHRSC